MVESVLMSFTTINHAIAYFEPLTGADRVFFVAIQLIQPNADHIEPIFIKLRSILPEYMVPQAIYILDDYPLTASGKINYRAVIQEISHQYHSRTIVQPRNALETKILKVWKKVLQIDSISIYDNFFELGGHSLSAIECSTRLKRENNLDYPAESLITHPTIAQMVEHIQTKHVSKNKEASESLKVTLLPLRSHIENSKKPIIFLSGGSMSEKEILLLAGLLPHLSMQQSIFATRMNLLADHIQIPSLIEDISALVVDEIIKQPFDSPPFLVGECIACMLTLHVARQLSLQLKRGIDVLLMNPWHPREILQHPTTSENSLGAADTGGSLSTSQQKTKSKYLEVLKQATLPIYHGRVMIFLPEEQQGPRKLYSDWWSKGTDNPCSIEVVQGNSSSYIREYRKPLSTAINAFCENK